MNLDDMEAFIAVVRNQSITHAAAVLSLSQPAISKRIRNLEKGLDVQLLDRQRKPPTPTAIGLQVYEHCLEIWREIDRLRQFVAGASPLAGGLRLGMTQAVCDMALSGILQLQRRHWPELAVSTTTGWANFIVERLAEGHLDAGIVLMPAGKVFPRNVVSLPLASVPMAVVARRGLGQKRSHRLAGLHHHGWILNPDGCGFRAALHRALAARNLSLKVNLDTFARETQLEMIAEGLGLGLLPVPLLEASPHRDRVETLDVSDFSLLAELWLCHPPAPGRLEAPIKAIGVDVAARFGSAGIGRTARPATPEAAEPTT